MPDPKPLKLPGGRAGFGFHISDVITHALADGMDNAFHLLFVSLHDEFDAAIGEVADVAADVMALGDVVRGVSEANPLNVSAEMVGASFHPPGSPRQIQFDCAQCSKRVTPAPRTKY
jgi:hypothetical protein